MPDKWEYDDKVILNWCTQNDMPYYHIVKVVEKKNLKEDIKSNELKLEDVPGVTVTPQDPKFGYKLNGGI